MKKAVHYRITWVGPYYRIVECVFTGEITVQHGHKVTEAPGWYGGNLLVGGIINVQRLANAEAYGHPMDTARFRSKEDARAEVRDQANRIRKQEKDLEDEIKRLKLSLRTGV